MRSRALPAAFFAAFLVVQVAVPIRQLFAERPARFGWHMYSGLPQLPSAWIVEADGAETPVDLEARLAGMRGEVDYPSILAAALCAEAGVVAIRLERGGNSELVACQ